MSPARRTRVGTMGIKICGHIVRMKKPIKIYTLVRASTLGLALLAIAMPHSFAAESSRVPLKSSSCDVATCAPLQETSTQKAAPAPTSPRHKAQRTAGTHTAMSPALALAMALGYRNVPGPVERTPQIRVSQKISAPAKISGTLPSTDNGHKRLSMNAAAVRMAIDD